MVKVFIPFCEETRRKCGEREEGRKEGREWKETESQLFAQDCRSRESDTHPHTGDDSTDDEMGEGMETSDSIYVPESIPRTDTAEEAGTVSSRPKLGSSMSSRSGSLRKPKPKRRN